MNKFFEFVGFEYKKMLVQRFSRIVLAIALVIVVVAQLASLIFSASDAHSGGMMANMREDRAYAREIAGQPLTTDLLISSMTATSRTQYREVFRFWADTQTFTQAMPTNEEIIQSMQNFYTIRHAQTVGYIHELYERNIISAQGLSHMLQLNENVSEPWAFYYTRGYERFFTTHLIIAIIVAFIIVIHVAPIFANEHSTNVAQLILTSKFGKNKLILAKIFAAITFGMLANIIFFGVSFLVSMAVFGFDGASAPFQLFDIHSPFPFTMLQTALIYVAYATLRTVMFTAILVWISAKGKSAFIVIVVAVTWIIAALIYMPIPSDMLRLFFYIFPELNAAFSTMPYEIFGRIIMPYVFEPLVAVVVGLAFLPFAGRAFARHQIG